MARKAFIIVGVLVVIGIAVGVIVAVTGGKSSSASTSSGGNSDAASNSSSSSSIVGTVAPANVSDDSLLGAGSTAGSSTANATVAEPTSDPETGSSLVCDLMVFVAID